MLTLFIFIQVISRIGTWVAACGEGVYDAKKVLAGGTIRHGQSLFFRVLIGAVVVLGINWFFTKELSHLLISSAIHLFVLGGYYLLTFDAVYNLAAGKKVTSIGTTANTDKLLTRIFRTGKGAIKAKVCLIAITEIMFWGFYFGLN